MTWCPVSWLEGDSFPYFPTEMMRDYQMKRPPGAAPGGARHAAPPDQLAALYPLIAEHLTSLQYDDDPPIPRETSTLLLFAQDGAFRACLRDRQEKRCLWVACTLWDELLLTLETALEDPNAVWREDRLSGSDNAKRIKRP